MEQESSHIVMFGWMLVTLYAAGILFFCDSGGARQTRNIDDYALGSILFSPYAVGLSLAASITSAATFIINPGFVALFGISGVLSMALALPLAALLSLVVLTKGFRRHGTRVKALSMAQWMGTRYQSRGYGIFFRGIVAAAAHLRGPHRRRAYQGAIQYPGRTRILGPHRRRGIHLRLYDVRRGQFHGLHQHHPGSAHAHCGLHFAGIGL